MIFTLFLLSIYLHCCQVRLVVVASWDFVRAVGWAQMETEGVEVVQEVMVAAVALVQGSVPAAESAQTEPFVSRPPLEHLVQGFEVSALVLLVVPMVSASNLGWFLSFVFLSLLELL